MSTQLSLSHIIDDTWTERFCVQLTFNIQGEEGKLYMHRSRLSRVSFWMCLRLLSFYRLCLKVSSRYNLPAIPQLLKISSLDKGNEQSVSVVSHGNTFRFQIVSHRFYQIKYVDTGLTNDVQS